LVANQPLNLAILSRKTKRITNLIAVGLIVIKKPLLMVLYAVNVKSMKMNLIVGRSIRPVIESGFTLVLF